MNISQDMAYLAGILRDGSLPKPYNNQYEIQVSQDNIIWLEKVKEIMQKLFPEKELKIIKYGKQTPRIKIYSKEIYYKLTKLFEYPGMQSKWEIPSVIRTGSKEIKKSFIRGFFDAEGEVPLSKQGSKGSKYKIWIRFHHSWDGNQCIVLEQMKRILEKEFNILCGNVSGPKNEKNYPSFDLAIYGRYAVQQFFQHIGSLHPKHNERLKTMLGKDMQRNPLPINCRPASMA